MFLKIFPISFSLQSTEDLRILRFYACISVGIMHFINFFKKTWSQTDDSRNCSSLNTRQHTIVYQKAQTITINLENCMCLSAEPLLLPIQMHTNLDLKPRKVCQMSKYLGIFPTVRGRRRRPTRCESRKNANSAYIIVCPFRLKCESSTYTAANTAILEQDEKLNRIFCFDNGILLCD